MSYPRHHPQNPPENPPENPQAGSPHPADAVATLLDGLDEARVRARARPRSRPFVTLAYAQSLDGSITTARGQRYALSGPDALRFTHTLRARHDAILVGVGTVLADDPELRVRLVDGPSPQPIIVDSRLRTPPTAKLLRQSGRPTWIAASTPAAPDPAGDRDGHSGAQSGEYERRSRVQAQGGKIIDFPALANGWVDLPALLHRLRADGVGSVMVEGGARIITSFLQARLVDYVIVTIAPVFLGGLAALEPAPSRSPSPSAGAHVAGGALSAIARLEACVHGRLGADLVLGGEVAWPTE